MKRYKTDADPYGYDEDEHGKWVRYEDVRTLIEENARLRKEKMDRNISSLTDEDFGRITGTRRGE